MSLSIPGCFWPKAAGWDSECVSVCGSQDEALPSHAQTTCVPSNQLGSRWALGPSSMDDFRLRLIWELRTIQRSPVLTCAQHVA